MNHIKYYILLMLGVAPGSLVHAYDMMGAQIYAEDPYVGILNLDPDFGEEEQAGIGFHVDGDTINGKIWSQHFGWIDLQPSGGGLTLSESDIVTSGYSGSGAVISGKAWGQEIGWLEFGVEGGNQGVWIDKDGYLHGAAWSRQAGYFLFGQEMNYLTSKTAEKDKAIYWARTEWRPNLIATLAPLLDKLSEYSAGDSITVKWVPIEGTQSKVEISTNSAFTSGSIVSSGWLDPGVDEHTFPNLSDDQIYYVRVKSKNPTGGESAYSEVTSSKMDNDAPTGGRLMSSDGSLSADLSIEFFWDSFEDNGDIMNYQVEVSTSPDFADGTIIRNYTNYESTSVVFAEPDAEAGKTYYARVKAIDAVGNASEFVNSEPVQANVTGGVIMDPNNVPVVGATLTFIDENGKEYQSVTGGDGVYSLNLPEGHDYSVLVSDGIHADYETQFSLASSVEQSKKVLSVSLSEVEVDTPSVVVFQETVLDAEGNPIPGLLIQIIASDGSIQYVETDENGVFQVSLLSKAPYTIKIANPLVENYEVSVIAGETNLSIITLETVFTGNEVNGQPSESIISNYFPGQSPSSFQALIGDADNDGVNNLVEIQAGKDGDFNGDGVPDLRQNNVASLINETTANFNTLEALDSGKCTNFSAVKSIKSTSFDYPVGGWSFNIDCAEPGASQEIKIYLDRLYDTANWKILKNINNTQTDITDQVSINQEVVKGNSLTVIAYSVTDGGALDVDGMVNGVIVDPVMVYVQKEEFSTPPDNYDGGNAKSMVFRYAGQTREEARRLLSLGGEGLSKAEFAEAYKESLEEALTRNEGIEATQKTVVDRYGNTRFAGYIKGRLGVDDYRKGENKVVYRGTNINTLEQEVFLLAADQAKYPQYFWVSEASDVEALSPFAESIFFVQSHGLLSGDNNKDFRPESAVSWLDLLTVELWAREKELISPIEMRFIPEIEGIAKNASYESRVFYTARKNNLIASDFSRSEMLNREKLLKRIFAAFSISMNGKAVRSGFSDIAYSDGIFPFVTTAQREGWFKDWEKEEKTGKLLFKPNDVLERQQFALWIEKSIKKANEAKVQTLQKSFAELKSGALKNKYDKNSVKAQARVGLSQLVSKNDAAESHLRNREYKKNKPQYFGPTRAAWNPVNKDTNRQQMWFKDNTANIKRADRVNVVRRYEGVSDEFLVKQAEKLVNGDPNAIAKIRKMPRSTLEREVTRMLESSNMKRSTNKASVKNSSASIKNRSNKEVSDITTVDDIEEASRQKLEEKLLELMKREKIFENQVKFQQEQRLQSKSEKNQLSN